MFKTKEIGRTWTVHNDKLPDLTKLEYVDQSIVVLSSSADSLQVTINNEIRTDAEYFYVSIVDLYSNKIVYVINGDDFHQSEKLVGKVLHKRVFLVESSHQPDEKIQINVYKELKLITANYYHSNKTNVDSFPLEEWFDTEIEDLSLNDNELFNRV